MEAAAAACLPPAACTVERCRWRCAVDVIDELLCEPGAIDGAQMDQLLDLRWQLGRGLDAEATLRLFCTLRIGLERRHYLAFFRIRRWLENHVAAVSHDLADGTRQQVALQLDHYCVEAVRRSCLCSALSQAASTARLRIGFTFVNWPAPASGVAAALTLA